MIDAIPTTSKTGFTAYMEVLEHYLEESRAKGEHLALLLVELDNLRQVNTTMGYESGRQMLSLAAERLQSVCRTRDRVIQYSDQGFALLLAGVRNEGHAELAANKVWRMFENHVEIVGRRVVIEISMGIAMYPGHGNSAQKLMQAAEAAQSAATATSHWCLFTPAVTAEATGMVGIAAELDRALAEGELEMHYQPKLCLETGKPSGVEALMRWFHPERGPIRPDIFIGMAERIGKIEDLTWFALNTGLRQKREWPRAEAPFNVSINVTPQIVQKFEFAQLVLNALQVWDVRPNELTIEVTETALMTNPEESFRTLTALKDAGVRISIDDFGTGYSSLAYFKNIPATELKIDRSFVFKMLENPGDRRIVQTVIDLAHNFGLKVVAEGIENEDTHAALVTMGCDGAQGYHYAKPLSHADLCRWLGHQATQRQPADLAEA
ncbi:MAG: bifunctional diguanylate cyclase/phosphodiesterase [Gammaproteobacteria bacterium]|nr:bifunctional diguanylate cyclase/phosphodiesterase [Gammaproteobacteria bacterium]NNF61587.1 bifunctional diguanylate cyclase/phosphodiesterase [Gammaproteobacteria bacterium]